MVPRRIVRFLLLMLLLLGGSGSLMAQLDPRLSCVDSDFLDLYQRNSKKKLKPEIVSIFDFSESMDRMANHPLYNGIRDAAPYCKFTFNVTGNNQNYTISVSMSNFNTTSAVPVRADGTVVTRDMVNSMNTGLNLPGMNINPLASDARNWIYCTSHIKVVYNGITRYLPLPWCIMDPSSGASTPIKRLKVLDPVVTRAVEEGGGTYGTGNSYELDLRYQVPGVMVSKSSARVNTQSLQLAYGLDYVKWIFKNIKPYADIDKICFANGLPAKNRVQAVK